MDTPALSPRDELVLRAVFEAHHAGGDDAVANLADLLDSGEADDLLGQAGGGDAQAAATDAGPAPIDLTGDDDPEAA